MMVAMGMRYSYKRTQQILSIKNSAEHSAGEPSMYLYLKSSTQKMWLTIFYQKE